MPSKTNVVEITETTKKSSAGDSTRTYVIDTANCSAFIKAWNAAQTCKEAVELLQTDFEGMGAKQASGHASQLRKKMTKHLEKWVEANNVTDETTIAAASAKIVPKKFRSAATDLTAAADDMLAGLL